MFGDGLLIVAVSFGFQIFEWRVISGDVCCDLGGGVARGSALWLRLAVSPLTSDAPTTKIRRATCIDSSIRQGPGGTGMAGKFKASELSSPGPVFLFADILAADGFRCKTNKILLGRTPASLSAWVAWADGVAPACTDSLAIDVMNAGTGG